MRGPAAEGIGAAYAEEATALAELGPFFAVDTHQAPPAGPGREPWRSMGELTDGPQVLAARVAAVRAALAAGGGQPTEAVELRVAASVTHLGLVARIVSPYLALAVLYGRAPARVHLADLRWQPTFGGPYPLSLPHPADEGPALGQGHGPPPADGLVRDPAPSAGARSPDRHADPVRDLPVLADELARGLRDGPVGELVDACAALRVSRHVLWGNVASAVNGAAGMIGAARPGAAARTQALAGLLLDLPALRGTSARTPAGAFRRRSCCLIYRAAPGGSGALCGDCALSHVPTRSI